MARAVKQDIDVQKLWEKYEDIAMHFNDLLMRLRTQSLAGIAAVSAVVGIFSKEGIGDVHLDWVVAEAIFVAMGVFWVALWILDMAYYNRLLTGAVKAIRRLEDLTAPRTRFDGHIDMSTTIEAEFGTNPVNLKTRRFGGIVAFYLIVLGALAAGMIFSAHMRTHTRDACVSHSIAAQSLRC